MKYPYLVKHNGVWYEPNTEIPETTPTVNVGEVKEEKSVTETVRRGRKPKSEV